MEYKRLTYRNINGRVEAFFNSNTKNVIEYYEDYKCNRHIFRGYIIDRLSELEDKIENGELIFITHQSKYEKLLPCKCGSNRRSTLYWHNEIDGKGYCKYICNKCGYQSKSAKNKTKLRKIWNEEMKELRGEK